MLSQNYQAQRKFALVDYTAIINYLYFDISDPHLPPPPRYLTAQSSKSVSVDVPFS